MLGKALGGAAMILPTCKEVSTALARGDYDGASVWIRLRARLHLAICWHCRRFKNQLGLIAAAFKQPVRTDRLEALERAILSRLL
jgi:hypothetical protein